MPSEPQDRPLDSGEGEEKALCTSCMAPNEPSAHFCAKCGAPMSPYAATDPFESVFAEGHVYRQAAERPRSIIVVLGIWLTFGMIAVAGAMMLFLGREIGIEYLIAGAFLLPVSLLMIWKTTKNYLARRPRDVRHDS